MTLPERTVRNVCRFCGRRWLQSWYDPDECPNGCYDREEEENEEEDDEDGDTV